MKKLTWKEKMGYGMGEGANCILFGLVQSVLQKYYTDVLGIGVISIMMLFILARFWDAANDPLWGHFVAILKPDKTGRYRRWAKWFALPLSLISVLLFVKLPGLSVGGHFVWACVTYVLFGMAYTVINIPYGSMIHAMTSDERERSSLSVSRSIGGVVGAIPALIVISLCYSKNAAGVKYMDYSKILIGVVLTAALALVCYWIFYVCTREHIILDTVPKEKKHIFGGSIKKLICTGSFMTISLVACLNVASQQFSVSYNTYLFQYYFDAPGLTMLPSVFAYLPIGILMFCATKLGTKYGKCRLSAYGLLFAGLGMLALYFTHTRSAWVYIIVLFVTGFGSTFIYLLLWAIASESIDEVAQRKGVEDAYGYSFFSFVRKLGHCVAAVCVNMALFKIGYSGNVLNAERITDATLNEMYLYSVLIPAVLYLAMFVLLQFVYPRFKKKEK